MKSTAKLIGACLISTAVVAASPVKTDDVDVTGATSPEVGGLQKNKVEKQAQPTGKIVTVGTANTKKSIDEVLTFDAGGKLKRPSNFDDWVFLGTTIGMTYIDAELDPENPGLFSTVLMEPEAYQYFQKTGQFAEGTVFAKFVHASELSDGGVSMGDQVYLEMHVKDKRRYPETGSGFFGWAPSEPDYAEAFSVDMGCVACHKKNAAYDDVFTQFYPRLRKRLENLEGDKE